MIDKRQVRKDARDKVNRKGIVAVRCSASDQVWVSHSRDIDASQNGLWFALRNGLHNNKVLQAAWNLHGADAFRFEVLEEFDDDMPALLVRSALLDRQKHWKNELQALLL